ncbi:MAG: LacI family DNA-binding transcriptional regulator [Turicibacter sp.]
MATIKEVAKRAGVSVGTVSNVINQIEVKPKTKRLVEEAIEALGYEPNIYARGLKVNKTNTVALILPTVWHPFFSELAYHIEKNLRELQLKMLLCNSEGDYLRELEYVTMAKQNQVDGIIAITYSDIEPFVSTKIPIISIDRFFTENITHVSSDNFEGGKMGAHELVKAGCKKLCFIGEGSRKDNSTRHRKKGFISYCEEHQIPYEICEEIGNHEEFTIKLNHFLKSQLVSEKLIDGIFTVTDGYAKLVFDLLTQHQVKVPQDVQIIGFDGSKSHSNDLNTISTIRQPVDLIAKHAVLALNELINHHPIEKEIILPVHFIKGATTK